ETAYDDGNQTWKLFLRDGEARHEIYSEAAPIESPAVEGIGPDGTSLILTMPDGKDKQLKLSDGSEEPPPDFGGRYEGVIHDPLTHRIIGVVRLAAATSYHFLNRADQAAWDAVAGAYAGENVQIASWSADRKRLLVRVDGKRDGAAYQLVDLNAHTSITIAQVYKGISPFDVAEVRNVTYKAADGMEIQAYLTLPDGRDPKNLPLVVLPHGGPAARDEPGFDWWSQALASRGYAVLQPQFRGSDGFGHDFLAAGFGQWGRKMQSDVSDGVRYLAKQGTIDPKRVCIVGASYGGYAALAGITLEHGVYRCAVAVAGVSDPHRMLVWERTRAGNDDDSLVLRYWNRFMGSENLDDPRLNEISPLSHAAQADAPLLLIHGRDDTVVTIQQSRDMEDALESARKPVTFVQLDGEDHWLSRPETRLKMLEETVKFLEANNPPG
ncbi:MAG TPA: S9 family peptidase, partial [Rhizomicrobium sp.]